MKMKTDSFMFFMLFSVPDKAKEKNRLTMEKADNITCIYRIISKLLFLGSWGFVYCDGYVAEEKSGAEGGGEETKS